MAKKDQTTTTETVVAEAIPVEEEVPAWATRALEDSAMEVYQAPAAIQHRRKLDGPELLQYIAAQVRQYDDDDPAMALEIMAQVANMGSVDDVLNGQGETTKGRDITGEGLRCDAIKFVASTEAKGCPFFAVLSVVITRTSEAKVITVGGWKLVAQLGQLHYLSAELPEGSPYLVDPSTPGAIAKDSYPHFFKIQQVDTNGGRKMNYLTGLNA